MGKGDRRTRKGKIFAASYGISRPKTAKGATVAKAAGKKTSAASAKKKAK